MVKADITAVKRTDNSVNLTNLEFLKLAHALGWEFAPDYKTKCDFCFILKGYEFSPEIPLKNEHCYYDDFCAYKNDFDFDKNVVLAWKQAKRKKPKLEPIMRQIRLFQTKMSELEYAAIVVGDNERQDWQKKLFGFSIDLQIKQYAKTIMGGHV